jgi:bile acid-coenzyme A ligase
VAMVSYAMRLAMLAGEAPGRPAVTDDDRTLTRRELDDLADRTAKAFAACGVAAGDRVTIMLRNTVEFLAAAIGCWKLGATPQPVSWRLPRRELDAIVELADPKVVVGCESDAYPRRICLPTGWAPPEADGGARLPDAVSDPWKAMTSGGSSGRPKLILATTPGLMDPDKPPALSMCEDGCTVVPGPLYHNGPFQWATMSLLAGRHTVLLGRFDAATTLRRIAQHRADMVYLVPTMMLRIWRLPEEERLAHDLSSLKVVWHMGAPCPAWLKQAWIDWLGPERIWELYAGTEGLASTFIRGDEWLAQPGSVGRPVYGEVCVFGPEGEPLAPGEVGEIYLRTGESAQPVYEYVGATARTLADGWESFGDMGWADKEGYVYITDRRDDMVLVGGANVYPAEIEAALEEHPQVRSCAVVGLPEEDGSNRLHAIVHVEGRLSSDELHVHLSERLVTYKLPRTFEFVSEPVRDDAGKVRRSALRDARTGAARTNESA